MRLWVLPGERQRGDRAQERAGEPEPGVTARRTESQVGQIQFQIDLYVRPAHRGYRRGKTVCGLYPPAVM